jgi:hypothetical protein
LRVRHVCGVNGPNHPDACNRRNESFQHRDLLHVEIRAVAELDEILRTRNNFMEAQLRGNKELAEPAV